MTVTHAELVNVAKTVGDHARGKIYINDRMVGDLNYLTLLFNTLNELNDNQGPKLNDIVTLRWYTGDNLVFSLSFRYGDIRAVRMGQQIVEAWTIVELADFSIMDGTVELLSEEARTPRQHRRVDFNERIRHLPDVFEDILINDPLAA